MICSIRERVAMSPTEYGIDDLKKAYDLASFARLIKVKPKSLSYILYKFPDAQKYTPKPIPKKNGDVRIVYIPHVALKSLQKKTAQLLINCELDIAENLGIKKSVSHAFKKNHTILTNAKVHKGSNFIFNIDLENFFTSIHYGRIFGYLTQNSHYKLNKQVAQVISHMACLDGTLVQGSPLSPVISNMIGNIIDSRMITLCKKHRCMYSRYADDITISSRFKKFPERLAIEKTIESTQENQNITDWAPGFELNELIVRSGFTINSNKTRMHYKQSRQSVTGLVVNKRINIPRYKFKKIRAQVNQFTRTGVFINDAGELGSVKSLRGFLDFCFWLKKNNGYFNTENCNFFVKEGEKEKQNLPRTSFEWLFFKFFFSSLFIHNPKPTVMFEGETDFIYFKAARKSKTATSPIKTELHFLSHTQTIKDILRFKGGSAPYSTFVGSYKKTKNAYSKVKSKNIVVMVLDNDDGLNSMMANIKNLAQIDKNTAKAQEFIHLVENLYIVLTPTGGAFPQPNSYIEHLFEKSILKEIVRGNTFDPDKKKNKGTKTFGKGIFAREVIAPKKKNIDFKNFDIIFDRIRKAQEHYISKVLPNL